MLFYLMGTILLLFGGFLVVKHIFKIIRSNQILANVNTQIERLKICNQCGGDGGINGGCKKCGGTGWIDSDS